MSDPSEYGGGDGYGGGDVPLKSRGTWNSIPVYIGFGDFQKASQSTSALSWVYSIIGFFISIGLGFVLVLVIRPNDLLDGRFYWDLVIIVVFSALTLVSFVAFGYTQRYFDPYQISRQRYMRYTHLVVADLHSNALWISFWSTLGSTLLYMVALAAIVAWYVTQGLISVSNSVRLFIFVFSLIYLALTLVNFIIGIFLLVLMVRLQSIVGGARQNVEAFGPATMSQDIVTQLTLTKEPHES